MSSRKAGRHVGLRSSFSPGGFEGGGGKAGTMVKQRTRQPDFHQEVLLYLSSFITGFIMMRWKTKNGFLAGIFGDFSFSLLFTEIRNFGMVTFTKTALITGITGQDGYYLAELLLSKGYTVHGGTRSQRFHQTAEIPSDCKYENGHVTLHYIDITDGTLLRKVISEIKPDEIYNLAAQSQVKMSFSEPEESFRCNGIAVVKLMEAIRSAGLANTCKLCQASSSEMFGLASEHPQNETTPFSPRSPYACSKLYAYWIVENYRKAYNMFAVNAIMFNHESPRRLVSFVTRKITHAAAQIHCGKKETVELGNLDVSRDWGHAKDFVDCLWRMLQVDTPKDYVIATGKTHTVREFCTHAFHAVGLNLKWKGKGIDEVGIDQDGKVRVKVSAEFFRPTDVSFSQGDSTLARQELGWETKLSLEQIAGDMVFSDVALCEKGSKGKLS